VSVSANGRSGDQFRQATVSSWPALARQIAGLSYLTACFAALFAPALADLITPAILLPPLIGESSFCLWLLIKGVDVGKWNERLTVGHGNTAAGSAWQCSRSARLRPDVPRWLVHISHEHIAPRYGDDGQNHPQERRGCVFRR
jgi:hypothetical protein